MAEDLLSQKLNRLIRQDVKINITKKKEGEIFQIDATIEGNPIAAAFAIFQAIKDNDDLFHSLRFFISRKK